MIHEYCDAQPEIDFNSRFERTHVLRVNRPWLLLPLSNLDAILLELLVSLNNVSIETEVHTNLDQQVCDYVLKHVHCPRLLAVT